MSSILKVATYRIFCPQFPCDKHTIIESSKSKDIGIYYGLSFLWNAESPKNLQQTKAEEVRNSESVEDYPLSLCTENYLGKTILK